MYGTTNCTITHRCIRLAATLVLGIFSVVVMSPHVLSAAISQGYRASSTLANGSLAALKTVTGDEVVAADSDHNDQLIGVVVNSTSATLSLSRSTDVVQIATSGTAEVIVSTLTGSIKAGDSVTASPISGVGMKATDSGKVVGVARGNFDGSKSTQTATVKTKSGQTQVVKIGSIPVDVQVSYYVPSHQQTIVPVFLQKFSNTIAGKDVSVLKIVISLVIVLAATMVIGVLLFSGVRSSIISIGRNPLAQSGIYKGLLQVLLTSVGLLGLALGGAYIILTH